MQFTNNRKTTDTDNLLSVNVDLRSKGQVNLTANSDRLGKEKAEVYAKLGALLLLDEKWEEAVETYQNGIKKHPSFSFSYHNLGEALLKLERWEEAADAWGKAIEINPNCSWFYHKLGESFLQLKSWKELKNFGAYGEVFLKVKKALPKLPQSYLFMGNYLREKGLLEEAIACYKEAVKLEKEDGKLLVLLGETLLQSGDTEEAIACYLKAIELQPDFTTTYHKLRSIHKFGKEKLEKSKLQELARCYRQALKLQPNLIEIEINLANILTQQAKIEQAINCYQNIAYKKTRKSRPEFSDRHWNPNQLGRPNFIIIGTVKGGTTSLYNYICQHPKVLPATEKEVRFFNAQFEGGKDWYFAHFPPIPEGEKFLTGEASPTYLYEEEAAGRIREIVPEVKLIAVLRNPTDRAISHYYMLKKLGGENRSLEKAIAAEMELLSKGKILNNKMGYLRCGLYVNFLPQWREKFNSDRLLILKSEDLYERSEKTMKQVFDFLGLESLEKGDYKNHLPGDYPQINEEMRQRLSRFFQPYNEKLEAFLGKKFNWEY